MSKASLWSLLLPGCYGSGHKQRSKKQIPIQRLSFSDVSSSTGVLSPEDLSISLVGSNLYVFTLAELKEATQSFSVGNFLGEGGFGPVYRGFVDEKVKPGLKSQPVAVKLLDLDGGQGHKEWLVSAAISMASSPSLMRSCTNLCCLLPVAHRQAEVLVLGRLRHPHLVKLIGYCCEEEHRLLVYEFMPRGSLENHLFKSMSVFLLNKVSISLSP